GIGAAFPGIARLGRIGKDVLSQRAFARKLAKDPEFRRMVLQEALNRDEAAQFGIDLTRGQASRDLPQQELEQELIHGARGQAGQRVMTQFGEAQRQQVEDAYEQVRAGLGPPRVGSTQEAAET